MKKFVAELITSMLDNIIIDVIITLLPIDYVFFTMISVILLVFFILCFAKRPLATKISVQAPPNVTVIVLVTPQAQTN
ncbi:hypothetical protein GCM10011497_37870 [Elstera cyanobacteriorum]|uniref:Uncharacterized protein n=1 Tax=Elstera cyanobacteriorum TaxID=2022747 RepID=A0A255XYL2_9PROT|nr:hypothetical protein CHR90_00820 [Elstera cyanobacteriorum]GGA04022.1 hypothetical protein GCM10011497_37870 [Elstera cyanobacteriorum]